MAYTILSGKAGKSSVGKLGPNAVRIDVLDVFERQDVRLVQIPTNEQKWKNLKKNDAFIQGQNLALTVLYVPYSLDRGVASERFRIGTTKMNGPIPLSDIPRS